MWEQEDVQLWEWGRSDLELEKLRNQPISPIDNMWEEEEQKIWECGSSDSVWETLTNKPIYSPPRSPTSVLISSTDNMWEWEEEDEQIRRRGRSDFALEKLRNQPISPNSTSHHHHQLSPSKPSVCLKFYDPMLKRRLSLSKECSLVEERSAEITLEVDATNNGVHGDRAYQNFPIVSHSEKKNTRDKLKRNYRSNSVPTLDDLQQHFGRRREDVAKSYGISVSTMKHICRQHGISQWPFQPISRETLKRKCTTESVLSLEDLQQHFGCKRDHAAKALGVSVSTVKRICRKYGIPRCQYRKKKKVSKMNCILLKAQGEENVSPTCSKTPTDGLTEIGNEMVGHLQDQNEGPNLSTTENGSNKESITTLTFQDSVPVPEIDCILLEPEGEKNVSPTCMTPTDGQTERGNEMVGHLQDKNAFVPDFMEGPNLSNTENRSNEKSITTPTFQDSVPVSKTDCILLEPQGEKDVSPTCSKTPTDGQTERGNEMVGDLQDQNEGPNLSNTENVSNEESILNPTFQDSVPVSEMDSILLEPEGEKNVSPTCKTPTDGQTKRGNEMVRHLQDQNGIVPIEGPNLSNVENCSNEKSITTPTFQDFVPPNYPATGSSELAFQLKELTPPIAYPNPNTYVFTQRQISSREMLMENVGSSEDSRNFSTSAMGAFMGISRETLKRKCMTESVLSLKDLQQHFGCKRDDAARALGVSVSTVKRTCRKHGIPWWPYWKKKKVSEMDCILLKPQVKKNGSPTCSKTQTDGQTEIGNEMVGHLQDQNEGPNLSNTENGSNKESITTPTFQDSVPVAEIDCILLEPEGEKNVSPTCTTTTDGQTDRGNEMVGHLQDKKGFVPDFIEGPNLLNTENRSNEKSITTPTFQDSVPVSKTDCILLEPQGEKDVSPTCSNTPTDGQTERVNEMVGHHLDQNEAPNLLNIENVSNEESILNPTLQDSVPVSEMDNILLEPEGEKNVSPTCKTPTDGQTERGNEMVRHLQDQNGIVPIEGPNLSNVENCSNEKSITTPTFQDCPPNYPAMGLSISSTYGEGGETRGSSGLAFQLKELTPPTAYPNPNAYVFTQRQISSREMLMENVGSSEDSRNFSTSAMGAFMGISRETLKRKCTTESVLSLRDLQQHFGCKRDDAAKALGVSVSTVKRTCRKHGIPWWPYRKKKMVSKTDCILLKPLGEKNGSPTCSNTPTDGQTEIWNEMVGHLQDKNEGPNLSNTENGSNEESITTPTFQDSVPVPEIDCILLKPEGEKNVSPTCKTRTNGQTDTGNEMVVGHLQDKNGFVPDFIEGPNLSNTENRSNEKSITTPTFQDSVPGNHPAMGLSILSAYRESGEAGNSSELAFQLKEFTPLTSYPNSNAGVFTQSQISSREMPIGIVGSLKDSKNLSTSIMEAFMGAYVSESSSWTVPLCSDPAPMQTMTTIPHIMPHLTEKQDIRTVTFKAQYREKTIKFHLSQTSGIVDLEKEVTKRLGLEVGCFEVNYRDNDSEWILIRCDEDLLECFELSSSSGNEVVRLLVLDEVAKSKNSCKTCRRWKSN